MNIFVLDLDPETCAQLHCDKHVVKMIVETAQLLSAAHPPSPNLYKHTHVNHPCALWVRSFKANYHWTFELLDFLLCEYTHRYGKPHSCRKLLPHLWTCPSEIKQSSMVTPFAQAMPDDCKRDDAVEAYQYYYWTKLADMQMRWTNRPIPTFMKRDFDGQIIA